MLGHEPLLETCLTFTNIYCPLGIAFPSFLCSPTCGKVFIHLPAIHLIVSFLLALQFVVQSDLECLQTGMKNDKLSVQIWWHYPLVIRLPSRSLLILAIKENLNLKSLISLLLLIIGPFTDHTVFLEIKIQRVFLSSSQRSSRINRLKNTVSSAVLKKELQKQRVWPPSLCTLLTSFEL